MRRIAKAVVVTAMALAVSAQASEYGWTFEDTAFAGPVVSNVYSGDGKPTWTYFAARTTNATAAFGTNSVYLNGSSAYMYSTSTPFSAAMDQFSISMWLNPAKVTANDRILCRYPMGGQNGEIIFDFFSTGEFRPRFRVRDGGTLDGQYVTTSASTSNIWTHLVMVFNGTNAAADDRIRFWVNNVEVSDTGAFGPTNIAGNATTNWYVGQDNSGGSKFSGYMDEIFLADRALTTSEISFLYNYGITAALIPEPSLVALSALGLGFLALRGRRRARA